MDSQHDKLRQRLEKELSQLKSQSDYTDYDWFLRTAKAPQASLKPPKNDTGVTTSSSNNKASPTTEASLTSLVKHHGEDFLVELSRSKTTDARLTSSSLSRSSTNTSFNNPNALKRTSTNVATADIGNLKSKRVEPLMQSPPITPAPLSPAPKKKGFFKKLFGGKKDSSSSTPTPTASPVYQQKQPRMVDLSPTSSALSSKPKVTSPSASISTGKRSPEREVSRAASDTTYDSNNKPSSAFSLDAQDRNALTTDAALVSNSSPNSDRDPVSFHVKDVDPELSAYLVELEDYEENDQSDHSKTLKILGKVFSANIGKKHVYGGDVIPPHPDKPHWPSALATEPRYGGSLEKEIYIRNKKEREQSSMFGNLLHKTKTESPEWLMLSGALNESEDTPPFTFEPIPYTPPPVRNERRPPLKALSDVKPMKKVAFATTTFVCDPPQQIPSRNPRKGNVELLSNGEIVIHKIDPQDKLNSATGIVVGGSGHSQLVASTHGHEETMHPHNSETVSASSMNKTESTASMDQTIKAADKDAAAMRARAKQAIDEIDTQKESLKIDKPMVKRKKQMEKPVVTLKMDELYTRCCHLREILPIPATLKQIPKGSTDPIPYLHLRNPRPSMIEIWSLTDFIRIAPIICVAFDGVSFTQEMFRIVLASLLFKRYLEKLTLRNTPIDDEGWKMLSYFLTMNKALKRLDVTQCPTLDVNTQRIRSKSKTPTDTRMVSNVNDRSDRDWALFIAGIIFRGGLEELILTGCKIPNLKLFSNLLHIALPHCTKLGLAYNELTEEHCYIISEWMSKNTSLLGIDLAYNDLSTCLKPFIKFAKESKANNSSLAMLSLNSCNLKDSPDLTDLFDNISQLPKLRYLDLSGNKKLFKTYMDKLCIYLPCWTNVCRLNLDNCDLSTVDLVKLLSTLPLMSNINYVSIVGQDLDETSLEILCKILKVSNTLISVNFDKNNVSTKYQERIGLLTMRNVERQLYESQGLKDGVQKSILEIVSKKDNATLEKELGIPAGMSLTDYIYSSLKNKDVDSKKLEKVILFTTGLRKQMNSFKNELMDMYVKKKLNTEGKEILIKLLSLDSTINKAIELIGDTLEEKANEAGINKASADPLLEKIMERGTNFIFDKDIDMDQELMDSIKIFEQNPAAGQSQFQQALSKAKDPYDIVNLLKQLSLHNIKMSDLFVDDLVSTDDTNTSTDSTSQDHKEVLKVYDSILEELSIKK